MLKVLQDRGVEVVIVGFTEEVRFDFGLEE